MRWFTLAMSALVCADLGFGSSAFAQVFSEDFEVNPSGAWVVNHSLSDGHVDFHFDYSTVGIPPAPSGPGTHGLKCQANLHVGVFGGVSTSPVGLHLPNEFVLRFDWWANFNGPFPDGGSGSTNLSTFGVGTVGASAQWPGGATDCVWFAATGDGGSSSDYRAYSTDAPTSYLPGSPVYSAPSHLTNNTDPYYAGFGGFAAPAAQTALFPQQTGVTSVGSAGMGWRRVTITKSATSIEWTIDSLPIATIDLSTVTLHGDNVFFGHSDVNGLSSFDFFADQLLFTLIDNIVLVGPGGCNAADLAEPLGALDFSDVLAFLIAFGAQEGAADLAAPLGVWDFSDVLAFLSAFGAGCP